MKRADCGLLYDLYHDIEFHFQFTDNVFVSLKQLHFEGRGFMESGGEKKLEVKKNLGVNMWSRRSNCSIGHAHHNHKPHPQNSYMSIL